ncbi:MAG: hypothetical protein WKG03_12385 [Telluria sp.]
MLWSLHYQGVNPAIGLRKVEHVLGVRPSGFRARDFFDPCQHIQFFTTLQSGDWDAAVVEALDLASRYSQRWLVSTRPGRLTGTTDERTVTEAVSLSFELDAAQYYRTEVVFMPAQRPSSDRAA